PTTAIRHSPLFPYTTLFRSLRDTPLRVGRLVKMQRREYLANGVMLCDALFEDGKESCVGLPGPLARALLQRQGAADVKVLYMPRSEEHTSELQSLRHLVCRL